MSARTAEILGLGMITSLGTDARKTTAAVRAGLSRVRTSPFYDRRGEPIFLATVPEGDLPALHPSLAQDTSLLEREARMTRLAGAALGEALASMPELGPIPLLLSLPETLPTRSPAAGPHFLRHLLMQSGLSLDMQASRVAPGGRAAGVALLAEALDRIASRAAPAVLIGGVESPWDADWLAALDDEDRLRAAGVFDGFTPGEAAAFLLLAPVGSARKARREPIAHLEGVGIAGEPGHRYSAEPYRGEGLSAALHALFAQLGPLDPIRTVYAGINGESFHAKEWGVSLLRHRPRFADDFGFFHPADRLGDTGAAAGPLLLGLAALGIEKGYRPSPCLVWCSSDLGARGAAVIRAAGT
ncbi:3-oxoacyl-(acyl-carrier-protein) synthase [Minicystis rosea]|nr:3-oxoacyl-(acyl-carrier-protein) synthase [Minicystis rosea]